MKRYCSLGVALLILLSLMGPAGMAGPAQKPAAESSKTIIVIVADKLDGLGLFNSDRPAIKQLLASGACGLMNIRSASGYIDTGSGYLTLGSGGRSSARSLFTGALEPEAPYLQSEAAAYLRWSFADSRVEPGNLIAPEMGFLLNQAENGSYPSSPGELGAMFRANGWITGLIGNLDTGDGRFRPGGFLVADKRGVIDRGFLSGAVNRSDPRYPSGFRLDSRAVVQTLSRRIGDRELMIIDYGDFYRLDYYQNQMSPARFQALTQAAWADFDQFLGEVLALRAVRPFSLVLLSPSISKVGRGQGNLLSPIVIIDPRYPPGLLTSGTTKWSGLVANIDFLPTLARMGNLPGRRALPGRIMKAEAGAEVQRLLADLNARLVRFNSSQRGTLDWYMALISLGWIVGIGGFWFQKKLLASSALTLVLSVPLALILLPALPDGLWNPFGFLLVTMILGAAFSFIRPTWKRAWLLAGLVWLILIIDQTSGWRLIRFSALGYNAMAGSRYYGMGNEFMGIFLAASLIFAHLTQTVVRKKWPVWIVLGASIGILCIPQFGAKFGGILAGTAGFAFYLSRLYGLKWLNKRFWLAVAGFFLLLLMLGWWDSLRPPGVQTHIGRFIRLILSGDWGQTLQIIGRKLEMNLKLTGASPWMRIILLAAVSGVAYRILFRRDVAGPGETKMVLDAVLATGIAAYLVNDAGVLAFATCLAFGYTYILLRVVDSAPHPRAAAAEAIPDGG